MKKTVRILYLIGGFISLGLGWLGIIVPILPTTPFLLVASFCFARGSERFEKWFLSTKIYKKYLENYVNNRAMTLKQKWIILLFADFMMMFPLIIVDKWFVKVVIFLVMLCKFYYFMFRIDTIKEEK
ncbi:YbaN family protein [Clostridium botulinum]|uniref:YbaN family protein n=1 Tax=Clostridium botulinum TaxID=1491 RepID=UPI001C9A83D7|nr:YbaN family protein [Clostridium botulinum]MBY6810009.1 YbaN family protein [Clostridium botulinum]MBY6823665.1 YbaN family protein [Clostridium botulinum]MBY6834276.1 YbaN family protein [Clostridium botulinum]MBY6972623.1 YbaN family protein [Clostridium botulinum]MCS6103157.1 DUF454 domain-containing protein [Clostridium botulinum]